MGGSDLKKNNPLNMDFIKMRRLMESIQLKEKEYSWKLFQFWYIPYWVWVRNRIR